MNIIRNLKNFINTCVSIKIDEDHLRQILEEKVDAQKEKKLPTTQQYVLYTDKNKQIVSLTQSFPVGFTRDDVLNGNYTTNNKRQEKD